MPNLDSGAAGVRLHISPTGLAIVKAFESCLKPVDGLNGYFKPYIDPVGVLTIGWGHTNDHEPKFTASSVWSQKQCDDALAGVMLVFEKHVSNLAKVSLTQNEFDALVSWSYNTGGPATATLWKKLNAGDKGSIPAELAKWNRGGGNVLNGLVRRRKAEGELFAGNVEAALKTAQVKAASVRPPADPSPPIAGPDPVIEPKPPRWAAFFLAIAKLFGKDKA